MRDHSFQLEPSLFAPIAPFRYEAEAAPPWRWAIRDAANNLVASANTRAGARAATRWMFFSTPNQKAHQP